MCGYQAMSGARDFNFKFVKSVHSSVCLKVVSLFAHWLDAGQELWEVINLYSKAAHICL